MNILLEPFNYEYMQKAFFTATIVGAVCAFLSCYLMLKGWSLIGDALSHSVVPGVAISYAFGLPYSLGAFFTGVLAALSILWIRAITKLREDAIIGFIFTTFFAFGLLLVSLHPTHISVQTIVMGNILGIADSDIWQLIIIVAISALVLFLFWKDLLLVFFDETQARSVGLNPARLKIIFFALLSACVVVALQAVGAILVIAMVITPGATAYLLSDKFKTILKIATLLGVTTSFVGVYLSYFVDGATGALIVVLQTFIFLLAFFFAPKYGYVNRFKR